jgi:hypothetical protein
VELESLINIPPTYTNDSDSEIELVSKVTADVTMLDDSMEDDELLSEFTEYVIYEPTSLDVEFIESESDAFSLSDAEITSAVEIESLDKEYVTTLVYSLERVEFDSDAIPENETKLLSEELFVFDSKTDADVINPDDVESFVLLDSNVYPENTDTTTSFEREVVVSVFDTFVITPDESRDDVEAESFTNVPAT